jgi:hypothetical protein
MQEAITAVETTDQPTPQQEAMIVPVVEDTPEQEVKSAARLRQLAPEYHLKFNQAKRAEADCKSLRNQLTYHFAVYKAIHVGKGRDGNWKNFVEKELEFPVRTVDRWVADKVKLASGELPVWVVARIKENMDPEPEPVQEPKERPLELKLSGLTDEEKIQFNEAMDKFQPDVFSRIIFEAVTKHPAVLEHKEAKAPIRRMTFRDEQPEENVHIPQEHGTIAADLEQRAALEVAA